MMFETLLADWSLTNPRLLAKTHTSHVWQVTRHDGIEAALKLLHPGEDEELTGFDLLQAWNGQGAVHVYARRDSAILMELCPGPSLGDMVRSGHDTRATQTLTDVIRALHAPGLPSLQPLVSRLSPLIRAASSGPIGAAAQLAEHLLQTTTFESALHGDLHHDNILESTRGWLAIDPKGVYGDPAYECANAFRNPEGTGDLILDPTRIGAMADCFATRLGHNRQRLLNWAAAHCALSILWSRESGNDPACDLRLLPILLNAA
jgi:streptomycin 6-kinase